MISGVLSIPLLPEETKLPDPAPKVSILFAARDEEDSVRRTVLTLLAQDYPSYEVIAVNDRSRDRTGEVLRDFPPNEHYRVIDIAELPAGWLGKTHALARAFEQSSGDWLLFTDADVRLHPRALGRAVSFALKSGARHLALFPRIECGSWIEKIFADGFMLAFFRRFRPWAAPNPASGAYLGVGAFNLVRRDAYLEAGTHRALALEVVDDMELGRRLKRAGCRQALAFGHDAVSVRWAKGWSGILRSIEKNAFAGMGYRLEPLLVGTLVSLAADVLPFAGVLLAAGAAKALFGLSLAAVFLMHVSFSRFDRWAPVWFPLHPFRMLLVTAVAWRACLRVLAAGGITWRGTFYPLEQLRK